VDYIVLHHSLTEDSDTLSWRAIRKFHKDKQNWRDIGYHFGIEKICGSYEILVGRMLTEEGAHVKGHNRNTIGICLIGDFDNSLPNTKQWYLAIKLVASLCKLFNLDSSNVLGHNEFDKAKSCPGKNFSMTKFRESLKDVL